MKNLKSFKLSLLQISICLTVFIYGLVIARFEIFPFSYIQTSYHLIKKTVNFRDYNHKVNLPDFESGFLETREIITNSITQSVELRKKLSERVVLPIDLIEINTEYLSKKEATISASFYGITINSILKKTDNSNCLRIYIHGHSGDPFQSSSHNEIRERSISEGCDFLSMSMLGLGLNSGDASFPGRYSYIELPVEANEHKNYQFYYDDNNASKDPLALFLSGHFHTISSLIADYQKVSITGFSGGGWYAVWLSALIPEIDISISYAGSLPLAYHHVIDKNYDVIYSPGDWEQTESDIYDNYDYWELYTLMNIDSQGKQNRKAFHIYNKNDICCYRDPSASQFKALLESSPLQGNEVIILENNEHSMDPEVVLSLLNR
jgi:hypothetical protein